MRPSHIAIIGAPLDLGQGRRGVDMGPSAVRVANLNSRISSLGYRVEDLGNIEVGQAETTSVGNSHAKYLTEIAAACGRVATAVGESLARGCLPVTLGGDHSIAIGTGSGVSQF
jgi:arginase